MTWKSVVSDKVQFIDAITDLEVQIGASKKKDSNIQTLCIVFVSSHHKSNYHLIPKLIMEKINPDILIGCSGTGVIGNGIELEGQPGISIAYAELKNEIIKTFYVETKDLPDSDASPNTWEQKLNIPIEKCNAILLLSDPFTFNTDQLLSGLDYAYPNAIKSGGLISGGEKNGDNAIFLNDKIYNSGAVGI